MQLKTTCMIFFKHGLEKGFGVFTGKVKTASAAFSPHRRAEKAIAAAGLVI